MAGAPKGSRNNPNGRPPKNRALTEILLKALNHTQLVGQKRIANKRILAGMVVEAVTTGQVAFYERTMVLGTHEWSELVKWIYTFLEPPVQKNEHMGPDGGPIEHKVIEVKAIDYRTAIAALAPGSVGDSTAPGEDEDPFNGKALG